MGWVEYVNIFGWDDDRADWRIAQLAELTNTIAKGHHRKYGSWQFFMFDPLNTLNLQGIIDQEQINMELGWANYLDAQERADDGNQTTGS